MLAMSLLGDLFERLGRPEGDLRLRDLRLRGEEEDPLAFFFRTTDLAAFPLTIFWITMARSQFFGR